MADVNRRSYGVAHLLVMEGRWVIDSAQGLVLGYAGKPIGSINGWGYVQLQVSRRHRTYGQILAHRLIWEYEHGRIPDGFQINHRNGVKNDNRLVNLDQVTQSENNRHAYRIGLKDSRGVRNNRAKLTDEDVRSIKRQIAAGMQPPHIARRHGVDKATVYNIRAGRRWPHVSLDG